MVIFSISICSTPFLICRLHGKYVPAIVKIQPVKTQLAVIARFGAVAGDIAVFLCIEAVVADIPLIRVRDIQDRVMPCAANAAVLGIAPVQNNSIALRLLHGRCSLAVPNMIIRRTRIVLAPCIVVYTLALKYAGTFAEISRCYINRLSQKAYHILTEPHGVHVPVAPIEIRASVIVNKNIGIDRYSLVCALLYERCTDVFKPSGRRVRDCCADIAVACIIEIILSLVFAYRGCPRVPAACLRHILKIKYYPFVRPVFEIGR